MLHSGGYCHADGRLQNSFTAMRGAYLSVRLPLSATCPHSAVPQCRRPSAPHTACRTSHPRQETAHVLQQDRQGKGCQTVQLTALSPATQIM
jgi:hypothetical protein